MRIVAGPDVIPGEEVFTEPGVPVRGLGSELPVAIPGGGRMGVCVERRRRMTRIARPPADRHLLRVHGVAHDEVIGRRLRRLA